MSDKRRKKVCCEKQKLTAGQLVDIAFDNAIEAIDRLAATALNEKELSDELMKLDRFIDAAKSWRQEVSWVLAVRQYFAKRRDV